MISPMLKAPEIRNTQVAVPLSQSWPESVRASKEDGSHRNSPSNLAFQTEQQSMHEALSDPVRSRWFKNISIPYQENGGLSTTHTVAMLDWAGLGEGLLVDISQTVIDPTVHG